MLEIKHFSPNDIRLFHVRMAYVKLDLIENIKRLNKATNCCSTHQQVGLQYIRAVHSSLPRLAYVLRLAEKLLCLHWT